MDILNILFPLLVLGAIGLIFGLVLGFVGKKFAVEADERVEKVRQCLGGANCGACGFAGCDAFAEAVVAGRAPVNGCTPGGNATAKAIGEIMGLKAGTLEPVVARVRCSGNCDNMVVRYEYKGMESCRAAAAIAGGPKACHFACVGLGDCRKACKFDAIVIENGVARIDPNRCTGCGMCEAACPRQIIHLLPRSQTILVACRNKAIGRIARLQCRTACVACGRCVKQCPSEAIAVVDGVAQIDETKCTRCGACVPACPMHCIHNLFEENLA